MYLRHFRVIVSQVPSFFRARLFSSDTMAKRASKHIFATPRPSASLIVVNLRNEILLVQRNPKATSFAGVYVFPGGNCDPEDGGHAMTAIRETFEESGLLLASPKNSSQSPQLDDLALDKARNAFLKRETAFSKFLSNNNLTADVDELFQFTQWVTPPEVPRRFHVHFFLTFLQTAPSSGFGSGDKQLFLPTPDDGQEVVSARFVHPLDALSEFKSNTVTLMPPQYYILTTLSDILKGRENTQAQRDQVAMLSRGIFGSMIINPHRLVPPLEETPKDQMVLTYEGDETRGGKPGRLHRAVIKIGSRGSPRDITLHRNFDIFTEIEPHIFSKSSRL